MEQNLPIIAKRCWKTIRVVYLMLRNSISKHKLLRDFSLMMKRSKLAGKAFLQSLILHHHHLAAAARRSHGNRVEADLDYEYEFSCSSSPAYFYPAFHLIKRKNSLDMAAALELFHSATASPALPGFGPSPAVRQLRISDSPFPLNNCGDEEGEGENRVDEAAEEFIMKFYRDLERQTKNSPSSRADS